MKLWSYKQGWVKYDDLTTLPLILRKAWEQFGVEKIPNRFFFFQIKTKKFVKTSLFCVNLKTNPGDFGHFEILHPIITPKSNLTSATEVMPIFLCLLFCFCFSLCPFLLLK